MEYYSVEKNKDILKFSDKWMELEKTILSEVIQTQKGKHGTHSQVDIRCKAKNAQPIVHEHREAR